MAALYLLGSSLLGSCHSSVTTVEFTQPLQPAAAVVPVRVVHSGHGYTLLRGNKPYFIKGGAGLQHLDVLRAKGGNSVRLYTTAYADVLLEEAQHQGLTVMLGLWMKPPYEKFDYYDSDAVAAQQREIYRQVQRFKNHPALLMWNLGNELDNHSRDFQVYQVLNETARMIHQLDPNHPVTTTLTDGMYSLPAFIRMCPDIDILTVNVFSKLTKYPKKLVAAGWTKPFIIGEFGGEGWWESLQTGWDAPLDQSGSVKAEIMRRGYQAAVAGQPARCLGSYALYWGNRFEQTDMWLSLFAPTGEKTPMVDIMQYLWTGQHATDQAPYVGPIQFAHKQDRDNVIVQPDTDYTAVVNAFDPEGESLRVEWKITREVDEFTTLPQYRTASEAITGAVRSANGLKAIVHTPAERGAYRLSVYVYDGHGSVTANSFPFFAGIPPHPKRGLHLAQFRLKRQPAQH